MGSPNNFQQLFVRIQNQPKDNVCCVIGNDGYYYEDLVTAVASVSANLQKLGIKKGDRVAVWLPNCFEWIVLLLAAGQIGAILVPLNSRFKDVDAQYVLKHSGSKILFTQSTFLNNNYGEIVASWNRGNDEQFQSDLLPELEHVVFLGNDVPKFSVRWEQFLMEVDSVEESVNVTGDDAILIQYTSGTTSFPKGALLTQFGVLNNGYQLGKRLHISSTDKVFSGGPFGHIGGVTMQVLMSLTHSVPFYTLSHFDPKEAFELVKRHQCTTYSGIDSLFLLLMDHPDFKKEEFTSVRTGWTTGAFETVKLIKEKMGIPQLLCCYGLSEASPNVSICDIDDPVEKQRTTCGRAHPGCEIRILDPETNRFLDTGEKGEIVTRGYNVMKEYYGNPEETKKSFFGEWLRTGDLGSLDEDGYLTFHGRLKEIIRVGGENFSPQEIEGLLYELPSVELVVVLGVPDDKYGELPIAIIKTIGNVTITIEEIQSYLKGKVAGYKVPRNVILMEELPMTESGKIQKNRLKEQLLDLQLSNKN